MTARFLEALEDVEYWRSLCPAMQISEEEAEGSHELEAREPYELDAKLVAEQLLCLKQDGYLILESVLSQEVASSMASAVSIVTQETNLPVFSMIYDAFWDVLFRLSSFFETILGEDYQVLPNIWSWHLGPTSEDMGWKPHRDYDHGTVLSDGTPRVLTLWVSLTHATPHNGCIYVLPASLDKRYHDYGDPKDETLISWQDVRALPAPAGSVLCWTSQLLHWGGRSSQWAREPRISFSFELQSSTLKAQAPFLLQPNPTPTFSMRLALIARGLLQYQHMHTIPPALQQVCQRLCKTLPKRRSFASVLKKLLQSSR